MAIVNVDALPALSGKPGGTNLLPLSIGAGTNQLTATTIRQVNLALALGGINVQNYGATGDGVTDDTAAILAAISALPTTGAYLAFPAGKYLVSSTLTFNNPVTIVGAGGIIDYSSTITPNAITTIIFTSKTANCIDIEANTCVMSGIAVYNNQTSPTAGAGVFLNKSVGFRMVNCSVYNFFNNVDFENGWDWSLIGCTFLLPNHNNLIIRDLALPDAGDQSISHCWFYSNITTSGVYQLQYTSGGGLKITNCKFNAVGASYYGAINASMNLNTVDFILESTSIENFAGVGVNIAPTATTANVIINGNQISTSQDINCVLVDGSGGSIQIICIWNNILTNAGTTKYCIESDFTANCIYGPNNYNNLSKTVHVGTHGTNSPYIIRGGQSTTISGSSVTYDVGKSQTQVITLSANTTISTTNFQPGDNAILFVFQDGTGGRTLTFSSAPVIVGSIDTRPNALSVVRFLNQTPYVYVDSYGSRGKQTVTSAGTQSLAYGQDYVFTGTTSVATLPAILAGIAGPSNNITLFNRGSGTVTVNSAAGGNDIYTTSSVATFALTAGTNAVFTPDGTFLLKTI